VSEVKATNKFLLLILLCNLKTSQKFKDIRVLIKFVFSDKDLQKQTIESNKFKRAFYIYPVCMRKTIAIALLILFASTNEVGQILKLPLLISHYIDHCNEEGQSIYAFIHEHYVHHHGANTDQDEDNQLPFKTTTVQQASVTYLLPALEMMNKPVVPASEKKLILPSAFILANYLKDIFHPPRFV
jgi:hypothetical protein